MRKIGVLHGWESSSRSNWFPWLQQAGKDKWYDVVIPDLPEAHAPILNDWLWVARDEFWIFSRWDILIWHSMWGKALMHYVEQEKISGVKIILVAPTYDTIEDEVEVNDPPEVKEKLRKFHEKKLSFSKLNALWNQCVILFSKNDKWIREDSMKRYYWDINNVRFIEFQNAGHFCKKDGFEKFSYIWKYI